MKQTTILITLVLLISIGYYIAVQQQSNLIAPGMKIINDTGIGKETGSNTPVDEEGKPLTPGEERIINEEQSNSGGGGSSDNNDQDSTSTTQNCKEEQISYSIGNFQNSKTCTEYQEETCTTTTHTCSAEVTNYDNNVEGTFNIRIAHYYIKEGNKTYINEETKSITLQAQQKGTIQKTTTTTQELNNENIYCEVEKESAPTKTVCN
jgi:hypothetical protein